MELSKFLGGRRKKDESPSSPPSQPPAPEQAPVPTPPPAREVETTLDDFAAIQSLLEQQGDTVILPLSVLLKNLSSDLQGPEWHDGPLPDGQILLDRESLSAQLKKGKLVYKLIDLGGDIPVGWIRGGAETVVALDLRGVVEALPEDFFRLSGQVSHEMIDAATMHDYFAPSSAESATPRPATPTAEPPRIAKREETPPSPSCERIVLNANACTKEDLLRIPGVSPEAADALISHRKDHGSYRSIFDVSLVSGMDAASLDALAGVYLSGREISNRWSLISSLLHIDSGAASNMATILSSIVQFLSARAALLATPDGIILAQTQEMQIPASIPLASAISLMQETRDSLRDVQGHPVQVLWVPTVSPPLLICASPSFFWILDSGTGTPSRDVLLRLQPLLLRIDELISPRFVVPISSRAGS